MTFTRWREAHLDVRDEEIVREHEEFKRQMRAGRTPKKPPRAVPRVWIYWRTDRAAGRLQLRVDDPRRTCRAESEFSLDGRLVDLHVTARDGETITTFDMKSPSIVADVRRWADAVRQIEAGEAQGQRSVEVGREVGDMLHAPARAEGRTAGRRRTGQQKANLLRAVADGYRVLDADPLVHNLRAALTRRLAAQGYAYDPGHVGRLIMQARNAGLLGPALPGRAGEAPVRPSRKRKSHG